MSAPRPALTYDDSAKYYLASLGLWPQSRDICDRLIHFHYEYDPFPITDYPANHRISEVHARDAIESILEVIYHDCMNAGLGPSREGKTFTPEQIKLLCSPEHAHNLATFCKHIEAMHNNNFQLGSPEFIHPHNQLISLCAHMALDVLGYSPSSQRAFAHSLIPANDDLQPDAHLRDVVYQSRQRESSQPER